MEMQTGLTAQEDRRRKLQEYLAAKGKLKPQTNTKPYLKDCTNRQNQRLQPLSKPAPVCKQRENVVKNTRLVSQENKTKSSSGISVQPRSRTAPAKSLDRPVFSATAKPRNTTRTSNSTLLKNTKSGINKDQQKDVSQSKTQAAVTAAQGETTSCAHILNGLDNFDVVVESNERLIQSLNEDRVQSVSAESKSGINVISSDVFVAENAAASKPKQTVVGNMHTKSAADCTEQRRPQTSGRMSAMLRNQSTTQIPQNKNIPKTSSHSSVPWRSTGKPDLRVNVGQTHVVTKTCQPASQSSTTVKPCLLRTSKTEITCPKDSLSTKMVQSSASTLKPINGKRSGPEMQSATGIFKTREKHNPCTVTVGEPAPKMVNVSNKVSDRLYSVSAPGKQAARQQIKGSTIYNKQAPRPHASVNHNLKQSRGTVSSYKSINRESNRAELKTKELTNAKSAASPKQSDLGPCDVGSRSHTTPRMKAEDRRKKLEEWLNSKGKSYKRPPMTLPPKKAVRSRKSGIQNCSLWDGIEDEEELLCLTKKINYTLRDCMELIERGAPSKAVYAALSMVPEGEKFAKFWVCKAKLLEREGIFDVIGLYEQAVRSGATPIDELREVIFGLMKNTAKKAKEVKFGPLPKEEVPSSWPSSMTNSTAPSCVNSVTAMSGRKQGSAVKFQVVSSKKNEEGQKWKLLTPVRRSLRITPGTTRYTQVLEDHNNDTVVASLEQLLDMADTDGFIYARNEAFPEETDRDILGSIKQGISRDPEEGPV